MKTALEILKDHVDLEELNLVGSDIAAIIEAMAEYADQFLVEEPEDAKEEVASEQGESLNAAPERGQGPEEV